MDPYPLETKWQLILPSDSPLVYLKYGLMSEFIMDKVKILRQKNHDDRVTEIVCKLHLESIDMLQDDIIEEASKLKNYNYKEWRRRPNIKREKVKFMLEKKIPLPAYDQCLKASHIFNLLDARGVIGVAQRTEYISRIRELAKGSGQSWLESQK